MTTLPDARALGFAGDEESGWTRSSRGRAIHFRLLNTLADLTHAERLQEEVFGVSEHDLIPASELIVVPETGGAVIAAFLPEEPERAAGVLVGWGGFVERPRIVSDFLAVRPEARNLGLAAEMKRLQAAIALSRGFEEIVWTVDPLRAANARLNFGKLGAIARHYEIDRYGASFATELYGGLPTDRLHVTWEITSPRVLASLTESTVGFAPDPARSSSVILSASEGSRPRGNTVSNVPRSFVPQDDTDSEVDTASGTGADHMTIDMSADIDTLLASDPDEALRWRLRMREALTRAFAAGFTITGFLPATGDRLPAYLLNRDQPPRA
jgi:predicted GNAT superfamily acetyltransferase